MKDNSIEGGFQFWLADMDDAIDRFLQAAPDAARSSLDLSAGSLDALEALVLARYKTPADTKPADQAAFLDGAARYFGEVLRQATESRWTIRVDDPAYAFHGLPILKGGKLGEMPCCPLTTVTAATDRRTGHYFSTIFRNMTR
jgi:hypothetical protein